MDDHLCNRCLKIPCQCKVDLNQEKLSSILHPNLIKTLGDVHINALPSLIELLLKAPSNTVYVSKLGDDTTGSIEGGPFLTITAAINAITVSGRTGITIFVYPGTYYETIVLPPSTFLKGLSVDNVVLFRQNVTTNTTVVTMGESSSVSDVSVVVTSLGHYQLIGIAFPGTTAQTAIVRNVAVRVDNSTASTTGTSNCYGVHSFGTAANAGTLSMWSVYITVRSRGLGVKRAFLSNTSAHAFLASNCAFIVLNFGGLGSYIGAEVNIAGASVTFLSCLVNGTTSDVAQTAGTLVLGTTLLQNATANSLGFSTTIQSTSFFWGDPGGLPSANTRFYRPGTASVTTTEVYLRLNQARVVKSLSVRSVTAPGGAITDTWTIRKNGVDTGLTVTLTGAATTNINNSVSVKFAAGDSISLKVVTGSSTSTTDTVVQVDLY